MTTEVEPELLIGSFIYDEDHRQTGIVEELRDGLVRYSVRTALGTVRGHYHWTAEPACYVLLEQGIAESTPTERMVADVLNDCATFEKGCDGAIFWRDYDGSTYQVEMAVQHDQD